MLQDDFADMARPLHVAEGVSGVFEIEGAVGEGRDRTAPEPVLQVDEVPGYPLMVVVDEHAEVDGGVSDRATERRNLILRPDPGLPDLDEAAAVADDRQTGVGMKSPASWLRTTSTPAPPVASSTSLANESDRESKT